MKKLFVAILFLAALFLTPLGLAAQPVKVEHKYGSTVVPEAPERIVTVGAVEQDTLLALGVAPVGLVEWIDGAHGRNCRRERRLMAPTYCDELMAMNS